MKKLLLLPVIVTVIFSCQDSTNSSTQATNAVGDCDTDTLRTEDWAKYPTYKKDYVQAMVDYYYTLPKTNSNVVSYISFPNPPVRKLLRNKESMVMIVGAYLTDTLGKKKGDRAVIIQLKTAGKFTYYEYPTVFPPAFQKEKGICPPPDNKPCPIEPLGDSLL